MPYEYIIKDGFVKRREVIEEQDILLEDFIPAVTTYMPIEMSPLPHNTRYIKMAPGSSEDKITLFIITEDQPSVRNIKFNSHTNLFRLALPYERFWFIVEGTKQFTGGQQSILYNARNWGYMWSNQPMVNIQSPAVRGWLPNVYPESNVCFGANSVNARQAFGHYIDAVKQVFWDSIFNHDLSYDRAYATFEEWQEATDEDPNVWTRWNHVWDTLKPMNEIFNNGRLNQSDQFPETLPDGPGEPIPPVRPSPTFTNVQNWWNGLTPDAQNRFRAVLDG